MAAECHGLIVCCLQVVRGMLLTKAGYEEKAAAASSLQVS